MMDGSPGAAQLMLQNLGELEFRLMDIRRGYDLLASQPDFDKERLNIERRAIVQSLSAVVDFIQNESSWKRAQLDFALTQFMVAIANVDQGKPSALFKAAKGRGRPPTPYECQVFQGRCAAVLELLMQAGWKEAESSSLIFRRLGEKRVRWIRGSSDRLSSKSTIEDWRDEVQGDSKNSPRGASYLLGQDELNASGAWGDKDKSRLEAQQTLDRIMVAIGLSGGPLLPRKNPRK